MKTIPFSYNWNNKLDCKAFTTLRLNNSYEVGDEVEIFLKSQTKGIGIIVGKKVLKLKDINEFIARIDTGYSAEECKKLIQTMYKKSVIDWENKLLYLYLIVKKK